jgi:hypothetical protein
MISHGSLATKKVMARGGDTKKKFLKNFYVTFINWTHFFIYR